MKLGKGLFSPRLINHMYQFYGWVRDWQDSGSRWSSGSIVKNVKKVVVLSGGTLLLHMGRESIVDEPLKCAVGYGDCLVSRRLPSKHKYLIQSPGFMFKN